ncbi:MAG: (2Fe-2S)-binding protein [Acidobacteriota bacterium]|nr:(2Fe-2S)-binding protein [Acidobacteriota bacterium]MDH3529185.1 (2Fe-2S)-binding protein [Acidobacteriota bacterium]
MSKTKFESELNAIEEKVWDQVLAEELSDIHEVDRSATLIWFAFFPIALHRYLVGSDNLEGDLLGFAIKGNYRLADQIDSSHRFMYGHRYWPHLKRSIIARANAFDDDDLDLKKEVDLVVQSTAAAANTDQALVRGIALVGLMTLNQTGLKEFAKTNGESAKAEGVLKASPESVITARSKDKKQGLLGFLRTIDKEFSVQWDESDPRARFDIIFDEEIASGAARDQSRDWRKRDERCIEGVIPVECRSAACGTCWVGVIGGAEKLSDVERLERKQMKVFGYKQDDIAKPVVRLACQARAQGSVSIVLPPWNGVFGKKIYGVEEVRLKPATSAAAKLRETIDAMGSEN